MDLARTRTPTTDRGSEALLEELLGELGAAARAFRFAVAPNPCVGAALLSDGVEIGRGFHVEYGGAHAEVAALRAAEASGVPPERRDTLVVTLEPCSSVGKTPACTEAILAAGLRRVVVGALDPDPRHRGKGLEVLEAAGVETILLPREAPLETVSPHFLSWVDPDRLRRPRPWTIAKWAQTRTGQLSPPPGVGDGRWISGAPAREEVQRLRGRVDAIVTGIGTVRSDDPRLTVRLPGDLDSAPLRVVLDSHLRIPPEARVLAAVPPERDAQEAGGEARVVAIPGASPARHRALASAGASVHAVRPGDDGRLSLRAVLEWLWEEGARRVLLECGPTLLTAWLEAELVDQVAVYTGDVTGGSGPTLASFLAPKRLSDVAHREVGDDALLEAFLRPGR